MERKETNCKESFVFVSFERIIYMAVTHPIPICLPAYVCWCWLMLILVTYIEPSRTHITSCRTQNTNKTSTSSYLNSKSTQTLAMEEAKAKKRILKQQIHFTLYAMLNQMIDDICGDSQIDRQTHIDTLCKTNVSSLGNNVNFQ